MTPVRLGSQDGSGDVDILVMLLQARANVLLNGTMMLGRTRRTRGQAAETQWRQDTGKGVNQRRRVCLSLLKRSIESLALQVTFFEVRRSKSTAVKLGHGAQGPGRGDESQES
jgi:stress response protein SCP2